MSDFIDIQETISIARRGMSSGLCQRDSKKGEAAMPAGVLVVTGASEFSCKVPAATGQITASGFALGITEFATAKEPDPAATNEYLSGEIVNIVTKGRVWMITEGAPTVGAPVFIRFASGGGGTQLGSARIDADTATAVALSSGVFRSVATNGVALVEINLPQ